MSECMKARLTVAISCSVNDERPSLSPLSSSLGTGLTPADCSKQNNHDSNVDVVSYIQCLLSLQPNPMLLLLSCCIASCGTLHARKVQNVWLG